MSTLRLRQNFHDESEQAINKQINMELHASYTYLAISYHFSRHDVALKGFHDFFLKNSHEEHEHAEKFMKYINDRGGDIRLEPIQPPQKFEFKTGIEAMQAALKLEQEVNESLLKLHTLAQGHNDPHLTDFIEGTFLNEQVESMKQLADYIANLERVGPGLGEFQFDKLSLRD